MSEEIEGCTHDCSSCGADCPSKKGGIPKEELHEGSRVTHVIGVVSGKGGVGKSLVTSLMAVEMQRRGNRAAILDADVTGPSIPKAFGVHGGVSSDGSVMFASRSGSGIQMMSINLLLDAEDQPVVWRGPVIAGAVKQFWTDVYWDDVDYMFVDMPPGTGDVPLTVFQSLPVDGILIVTTPQDLVSMIVKKAYHMAEMMNVPIFGLIENMSYVLCPDCGKKIEVFGESKSQKVAEEYKVPLLARIPLQTTISGLCDEGRIEYVENTFMTDAANTIEDFFDKQIKKEI